MLTLLEWCVSSATASGSGIVNRAMEKTLEFLGQTANEAAVPVLLAALGATDPAVQEKAFGALLARRRGAGQWALVERWHQFPESWQQRISEQPRSIAAAVRRAVLSTDESLCHNGCQIAVRSREYELIPALVAGAEDPQNPQRAQVAHTLLQLCELLEQEMSGPRDHRYRPDPARTRESVLPSLERGFDQFAHHGCRAIVEAFLMLASHEHPLLRKILDHPRHATHHVLVDQFTTSTRVSVMRLVLNLLEARPCSAIALQIVAKRSDLPFVRHLLHRAGGPAFESMRPALAKLPSIAWLEPERVQIGPLSGPEQAAAVQVLVASGMHRLRAFETLKQLLCHGAVEGRRAAAAALAAFGGAEANQLALDQLDDPDPLVQAQLVVQLRARNIPGAISRLVRLLESPHEATRTAASSCLSEFNVQQYLSLFDVMEGDARRNTGLLVMRIDPSAPAQLALELKSPSRTRRVRGLEAAAAMNAVSLVEPLVLGLLHDPDHFLRTEAARTLAYTDSPLAEQALRDALLDRSAAVREAAEQSLHALAQSGRNKHPLRLTTILEHVDDNPLLGGTPTDCVP